MEEFVGIDTAPDAVAQDRIGQVTPFPYLKGCTNGNCFGFTDSFESGDQVMDRLFA